LQTTARIAGGKGGEARVKCVDAVVNRAADLDADIVAWVREHRQDFSDSILSLVDQEAPEDAIKDSGPEGRNNDLFIARDVPFDRIEHFIDILLVFSHIFILFSVC
jgi:hypothetical protein